MGKTITHVGKQGAGQTVKLVNQILVVGNCLAISEALVFAQAGGVDLQKCLNAVSGGAAGSWMLANRGPQIIERDWRPGFTINLQQKDVRLIMQEADALGVPILLTSQIFSLYRTLQQMGLGEEGNHALVKALENLRCSAYRSPQPNKRRPSQPGSARVQSHHHSRDSHDRRPSSVTRAVFLLNCRFTQFIQKIIQPVNESCPPRTPFGEDYSVTGRPGSIAFLA